MQPHIHQLELGYVAYGKILSFVKAYIDYMSYIPNINR